MHFYELGNFVKILTLAPLPILNFFQVKFLKSLAFSLTYLVYLSKLKIGCVCKCGCWFCTDLEIVVHPGILDARNYSRWQKLFDENHVHLLRIQNNWLNSRTLVANCNVFDKFPHICCKLWNFCQESLTENNFRQESSTKNHFCRERSTENNFCQESSTENNFWQES